MVYVFAALIPIVAAAIIVIVAKGIAARAFQCKRCAGEFYIKWPRVLITEHSGSEYKLVCPHCHAKGWCIAQPKN